MQLLRRVALFNRFPKFNPLPAKPKELVPQQDRSLYPSFVTDFAILETQLMGIFRELDNKAKLYQNTYRWMYIILILGGALATTLTIIQIALPDVNGFGIAGAAVAAILGLVTTLLQQLNRQRDYLDNRLKAERLRSEYFMFLGHFDQYADNEPDAQDPEAQKRNDDFRAQQLQASILNITGAGGKK